jgi:hypothetical protein
MDSFAGHRGGNGREKNPRDLISIFEKITKTRQDPSLKYTLLTSLHINANSAQTEAHTEFSDLRHLLSNKYWHFFFS